VDPENFIEIRLVGIFLRSGRNTSGTGQKPRVYRSWTDKSRGKQGKNAMPAWWAKVNFKQVKLLLFSYGKSL